MDHSAMVVESTPTFCRWCRDFCMRNYLGAGGADMINHSRKHIFTSAKYKLLLSDKLIQMSRQILAAFRTVTHP